MSRDWMRDNYDANEALDQAASEAAIDFQSFQEARHQMIDKILLVAGRCSRPMVLDLLSYALGSMHLEDLEALIKDYNL